MKIKVISGFKSGYRQIRVGDEFTVRDFPSDSLFKINNPYQVIEGPFSGLVVPREFCILLSDKKVYTEKEWNDLKEYHLEQLKKEREQTAIFQGLARDLTDKVKDKNKEIKKLTFFVECSNLALRASCQAIETLKGKNN